LLEAERHPNPDSDLVFVIPIRKIAVGQDLSFTELKDMKGLL
jgi:hypothetical protein